MFLECFKTMLLGFCAGALLGTMVCGARIQPEQMEQINERFDVIQMKQEILIEELKKLDVKGRINWDKL